MIHMEMEVKVLLKLRVNKAVLKFCCQQF